MLFCLYERQTIFALLEDNVWLKGNIHYDSTSRCSTWITFKPPVSFCADAQHSSPLLVSMLWTYKTDTPGTTESVHSANWSGDCIISRFAKTLRNCIFYDATNSIYSTFTMVSLKEILWQIQFPIKVGHIVKSKFISKRGWHIHLNRKLQCQTDDFFQHVKQKCVSSWRWHHNCYNFPQ